MEKDVKYKTYPMSKIEIPHGWYNLKQIKEFLNILSESNKKSDKILGRQVINAISNK